MSVTRWTMQGYDEQAVDHADGEWVMYGDHVASRETDARALAEKDARIAELERSLRQAHESINDCRCGGFSSEKDRRIEALERALREAGAACQCVPCNPWGGTDADACARKIAREALAPARPTPAPNREWLKRMADAEAGQTVSAGVPPAEKPCSTCGGSGVVRNPYPPPMRGMRLEPCPDCTKGGSVNRCARSRCKRTGNPCGTDTIRVGYVCSCAPCLAWANAKRAETPGGGA